MANNLQEYIKLEQRLTLLAWLNDLFGYSSNRELLADLKDTDEGFDSSGHSFIYHRLISRGDQVRIPSSVLARYDENIRTHLHEMNIHRAEPVVLRYFQHLAALYAEVFLDNFFNHRAAMLSYINSFIRARNARRMAGEALDDEFSSSDLTKLAFWMATGSGKTLIMHINYRQFLTYNTEPLDNILLITPYEGLSDQHLAELAASGIPAQRFNLNESGLGLADKNTIRVIEITKLVDDKRGGGVSVPVEAFEGNNLIFVDEGHKGSAGVAWRGYRDALGKTGFTFEYSATFGQALTAARNDQLTAEYGKSIIFDYSYRYFYGDGYGKDFRILNLQQETTEEQTETLLLGNLLSFYEQQRVYSEGSDALQPYNLEPPLWVFVGGTVNAVYTEDKHKRSDVLTVVRFLHHILANHQGWVVKTIKQLLGGKTGINIDRRDVFLDKFPYLKEKAQSPDFLYQDILTRVFHAPSPGGLHLCDIRGCPDELGLKASGGEDYFGLIYVGDTSAFKNLLEEDKSGITQEDDAIAGSLFASIGDPGTGINILIGAKKFMEGWNSWRVSAMGLLNIGRQEGSQIIQLFGRGVRLRGKEFSLKRSVVLPGTHPPHIRLLETLNMFAVRANFMTEFRKHLEKEGVETSETIELPLFIWANQAFLQKGLQVPRLPENSRFAELTYIILDADTNVQVTVDMSLKVEAYQSGGGSFSTFQAQAGRERSIPDEGLTLVDWERVYLELLEYKERRRYSNLVIPPNAPRQIITTKNPIRLYRLVADDTVVSPTTFSGVRLLQDAVLSILKKYLDEFYRLRREQWESNQMIYHSLDEADPNLCFNRQALRDCESGGYVVKVQSSDRDLVSSIQQLISDAEALRTRESETLPRIHFDRHLYQPLLLEHGDKVKMVPPGLKPSEETFVKDIKEFWAQEKDKSLSGIDVFLLRNLSRGSGIGFFEERGFYPDFILWIVDTHNQHIIFIEPHGMIFSNAYQHDTKAQLHLRLPDLAQQISQRSKIRNITLDSYIISATPYANLRKRYGDGSWDLPKFASAHILFLQRTGEYDYLQRIFSDQLSCDMNSLR